MIIEVSRIPPEGETYSGEEPASVVDVEPEADLRLESPLRYRLRAIMVSGELIVNGQLETNATFRCSRCGEWFSRPVEEPAFELVKEVTDPNTSVDLTPDIRESMLLALPSYPVCSPGCKGLCSQCGVNLNKGRCSCKPRGASGWEALDHLRTKN